MSESERCIEIFDHPSLNNPYLIAAWPGVANVGLTALHYLRQHGGAEEFASIDPNPFFDLAGIFIEDNLIQDPLFPQNRFYYIKGNGKDIDLIVFESDAQPGNSAYYLANAVLDLAQQFNVSRVYTLAAALVDKFNENPGVWVAATHEYLLENLRTQGLNLKGDFHISGMNGLLLSVAKERNMEGICFLGETPQFPSETGNPFASLAVAEVLAKTLSRHIDLSELKMHAANTLLDIERFIAESRQDFLDQFTVPLWERFEEENT
ncbi:MAG: PAC2 family protein [Chloroflexota bacterium]|nr:PAC2 family protein [Chloroflexota bacterium]